MGIKERIRLSVLVLASFSIINILFVFYQVDRMHSDARVVNFTGIVRGITQRLVKLELTGKPSDELINRIDGLVRGLLNGNAEMRLPPATDPAYHSRMQEVASSWQLLRSLIIQARKKPELREDILRQSERFWETTNNAVFAAEKFSARKHTNLKVVLVVLLVMNLLVLTLLWIFSKKHLSEPLKEIAEKVNEVFRGNLNVRFGYSKKDEIGLIADNMNKLIKYLKAHDMTV